MIVGLLSVVEILAWQIGLSWSLVIQHLLSSGDLGFIFYQFFKELFPINPIETNCEIRLFVFRERPGSFASPTTNGTIIGSRSDEVTILYQPLAQPL